MHVTSSCSSSFLLLLTPSSYSSHRTAVMRGVAHDRGLFVPDTHPAVAPAELESWRSLGYAELATAIIRKFAGECKVPRGVFVDIVQQSCAAFWSPEVTPLVKVDGHNVLVSYCIQAQCALVCAGGQRHRGRLPPLAGAGLPLVGRG